MVKYHYNKQISLRDVSSAVVEPNSIVQIENNICLGKRGRDKTSSINEMNDSDCDIFDCEMNKRTKYSEFDKKDFRISIPLELIKDPKTNCESSKPFDSASLDLLKLEQKNIKTGSKRSKSYFIPVTENWRNVKKF